MSVTFYRHPLLLLEAEELVFAYVNGTSPQKLSRANPGRIPTASIEKMMEEACGAIDLKDRTLQFFFQRYTLPKYAADSCTCIGRLLVFSFADWACSGVQESIDALSGAWSWESMLRSRLVFTEIMPYGISLYPWDETEPVPFTNGLAQLPIPKKLKDSLLEVFSDFQTCTAQLAELLRPVMEYLEQALLPFVQGAEAQIASWETEMCARPAGEFIRDYMHLETKATLEHIVAAPLFLVPTQFIAHIDGTCFYALIGMNGVPFRASQTEFRDWAYQALRLLGSPTRMSMLEALKKQPMTAQELTKALGLPYTSSVVRDLNSMQMYHLLDLKLVDSHKRYSVNCGTLELLIARLRSLAEGLDE